MDANDPTWRNFIPSIWRDHAERQREAGRQFIASLPPDEQEALAEAMIEYVHCAIEAASEHE